ncbi:hypothetical protein BK126_26190 [Paenibacillus sp. FSL H7-0326]|uniref:hypothetical protein n=1 Tax=Paenibacillus sp. FSL H7-0326 TaxID=1921144 RepID=UPI00096FADEA|nr:hypothetical protein [Paenibacillus sp. FSL H7-0326]OMC63686.1 hypothetical protein BK126_26190 [Paenibacillus sp. FSL H7-0326]
MNKKAVLDVLNSLEVVEENRGDNAYILVKNTTELQKELAKHGVDAQIIMRYGWDRETFCILAFSFGEGIATDYEPGKGLVFNEESKKESAHYLIGVSAKIIRDIAIVDIKESDNDIISILVRDSESGEEYWTYLDDRIDLISS